MYMVIGGIQFQRLASARIHCSDVWQTPLATLNSTSQYCESSQDFASTFVPTWGGHLKAMAQQVDGHPDIVIKNAAQATGGVITKVPNGEMMMVLTLVSNWQ